MTRVALALLLAAVLAGPAGAMARAPEDGPPDAWIASAVERRLHADPAIRGRISVQSQDGVVELFGFVPHLVAKDRAAAVADTVAGVRVVVDCLEVDGPTLDDATLLDNARATVADAAPGGGISVSVASGVVTLSGAVRTLDERDRAHRSALGLRGARAVENDIAVHSDKRSDDAIVADVAGRLRWHVWLYDDGITVSVKSGAVSLSGAVDSSAERISAMRLAFVPGARAVSIRDLEVAAAPMAPTLHPNPYVRREDRRIAAAIADALSRHPRLDGQRLQVNVEAGAATISGNARDLSARRIALELAAATVGVREVEDRVTLSAWRPDEEIVRDVRRRLASDALVDPDTIRVSVEGGKVRLAGKAADPVRRDRAADIVAEVAGTTAIENTIFVAAGPKPRDADVAHEILAALSADVHIDSRQVQLDVQKGRARMWGIVDSLPARGLAGALAIRAGAVSVDVTGLVVGPRTDTAEAFRPVAPDEG